MEKKLTQNEVHEKGLGYVSDRLGELGWDVEATPRASQGINIRAERKADARRITIQVKSLTRGNRTGLGKNFTGLAADFLVVCGEIATEMPECFILTRAEVNRLAVKRRDGQHFLNDFADESFREKWEKLDAAGKLTLS